MRGSEPTNGRELPHWAPRNWTAVEANVRHRQGRLARAAAHEEHAQVQHLQKLMARSMSAKLQALRQVTQEPSGQQTPGLDGGVCEPPQQRLPLGQDGRNRKGYRPTPVKRGSIPTRSGGQRPLGLPTQKERVLQARVKRALAPAWASRFEAHASGGRPGRCTLEAITALHPCMHCQGARQGGRDADRKGGVDHSEHAALRKRLPGLTTTMRRWLPAGGGRPGPLQGHGSRDTTRRRGLPPARAHGLGWHGTPLRGRRDKGAPPTSILENRTEQRHQSHALRGRPGGRRPCTAGARTTCPPRLRPLSCGQRTAPECRHNPPRAEPSGGQRPRMREPAVSTGLVDATAEDKEVRTVPRPHHRSAPA